MQGLESKVSLEGKTYRDIEKTDPVLAGAFEMYVVCVRIVPKTAPPDAVFEIYHRINTGAENLNDQQIRRAAYRYGEL